MNNKFEEFYQNWDIAQRFDEVKEALTESMFKQICEICYNTGAADSFNLATERLKESNKKLDEILK